MKKNILKILSANTIFYRTRMGMTQEDLATASNLHRSFISLIERGERNISSNNIEKLANALNVEPYQLLQEFRAEPLSVLHQPYDNASLGNKLIEQLSTSSFTHFHVVVAYAKLSGVLRLKESLKTFKSKGGTITICVGIDQHNTTYEALTELLTLVDNLYVIHNRNLSHTLHHKLYMLSNDPFNPCISWIAIGSNNLTAGGLFINYESCLYGNLDASNSRDSHIISDNIALFNKYTDSTNPLVRHISDQDILEKLLEYNYIVKEGQHSFIPTKTASSNLSGNTINDNDSSKDDFFGRETFKAPSLISSSTTTAFESNDIQDPLAEIPSSTNEAVATITPPTIPTDSEHEVFWFEMRKSTGGSRNILDLSSKGKLLKGTVKGLTYDIDGSDTIQGSVTFFDISPNDHTVEKNVTLTYKGNAYYPSTIKYAYNNQSWRIQLKGDSPTDTIELSKYGKSDFMNNILLFTKIATDHYILEVLPASKLAQLQNSSVFYATNGINPSAKQYGKLK